VPNITPNDSPRGPIISRHTPRGSWSRCFFTARDLVDELIRRVGPEEACRLLEVKGSVDEMRSLADEYDRRLGR
jgi:hypothetical protein